MMPECGTHCRPRFRASCLVGLAMALLAGCASQPSQPEPAQADPEQARIHAQQGVVAHEAGRTADAIAAWQRAVALNPADAITVNNLALLLKEQKRFAEAVDLLEKGLRHSPEVAELHYNLAVIAELYLLDLESALAHYRRYQALAGRDDTVVAGWIADLERRLN
nr:tetratricopeptide repeat protein [uncultured Marinobacter sp.]